MIVKKWMSRPVSFIQGRTSLLEAARLFRKKTISILPVMQQGKISGIITESDIKKASQVRNGSLYSYEQPGIMDDIKADSIMKTEVITIQCDCTVDEAAQLMLSKDISGMPVVDRKGSLQGVITKSDIFRCFVSFTGVVNKGQIFAFRIKDRPGIIKCLTEAIRKHKGRLNSVLTSYDDIDEGFRKVFIYAFDIEPEAFDSLVTELNHAAKLIYAADQIRGIRRLF